VSVANGVEEVADARAGLSVVVVDPADECFEGTYLYDGENLSVIVEPSNRLLPEAGSTVWIRDDANPTVLHAAYLSDPNPQVVAG
jgi:hypothetical protein